MAIFSGLENYWNKLQHCPPIVNWEQLSSEVLDIESKIGGILHCSCPLRDLSGPGGPEFVTLHRTGERVQATRAIQAQFWKRRKTARASLYERIDYLQVALVANMGIPLESRVAFGRYRIGSSHMRSDDNL